MFIINQKRVFVKINNKCEILHLRKVKQNKLKISYFVDHCKQVFTIKK